MPQVRNRISAPVGAGSQSGEKIDLPSGKKVRKVL
jgi:hypothetical protein